MKLWKCRLDIAHIENRFEIAAIGKAQSHPDKKTKQRKNEDNNTRKRSATGNFRTT